MVRIMQRFYVVLIFICLIFLSSCSSIAETTDLIRSLDGIEKTMNVEATTETFTLHTVEETTVVSTSSDESTSTSAMPSSTSTATKTSTAATIAKPIESTETVEQTAITATEAKPTEPTPSAAPSTEAPLTGEAEARAYVLNTNTMKFHYPTCGSAKKILPENRQEINSTRDNIISMGYDPCGNCKP